MSKFCIKIVPAPGSIPCQSIAYSSGLKESTANLTFFCAMEESIFGFSGDKPSAWRCNAHEFSSDFEIHIKGHKEE